MSKGRKPLPPATQEGPQFVTKTPEEMTNHPVMSPRGQEAMNDAVRLGHAIGRIQTAAFYQTISDSVKLAAFKDAKESKAYRMMINPETQTYFGSLEEFCEAKIGVSYERMRQIASNEKLLGPSAYEQGERLGLRQVDYNAIKALPAPKQEIIRQAADEATSREDLTRLIHELAAQDQREHEQLTAQLAEATERLAAKDKVIEQTSKAMNTLREEIAGKKPPTPEFLAEQALAAIDKEAMLCAAHIIAGLRSKFVQADNLESAPQHRALIDQAQAAAVGRVLAAARQLAEDYGIGLGADAAPEAYDEMAADDEVWKLTLAEYQAKQDASAD